MTVVTHLVYVSITLLCFSLCVCEQKAFEYVIFVLLLE